MIRRSVLAAGLAAAAAAHLVATPVAAACGCLSPPVVTEGDFAVNQAAEELIFEVEPGWVTAHVLIKYQGNPSQFAWIVPVPEVPELSISPSSAFGLLDQATAPNIQVSTENVCPIGQYQCVNEEQAHDSGGGGCGGAAAKYSAGGGFFGDAGALSDAPGGSMPPVTVLGQQTIGDYQTVTFQASQASAAVQWLQDNGFVVNSTTSIYMESYIQANMVFVAAKLVPGAGVSAIKPLRMRYRAAYPSVPLILTAVAAQPHLTITAFLFGNQAFQPMGHPIVTIDQGRLAQDPNGRFNYPQLMARQIDEAGGDGFVIEYSGTSLVGQYGSNSYCCSSGYDACGLGGNGQCECPGSTFDAADCEATIPDIADGVSLLQLLSQKYSTLTRITTRISPEEMTFDPTFEPTPTSSLYGNLYLYGQQYTLQGCEQSIIDPTRYASFVAREACTSVYCGSGECVTTQSGPACLCNAGTVAQRFIDLDGQPSVTCVPAKPPADLRAGGAQLPDACATASCGAGTCVDRNGVPVCECQSGAAAGLAANSIAPYCDTIKVATASPGADNYSAPIETLPVCAPAPPACASGEKLQARYSPIVGVDCGNMQPSPDQMMPTSSGGCCQESPNAPPFGFMFGALFVLVTIMRRRR